jgi:hypothetical protein
VRNISFGLTVEQFKDRQKDVTRRLGWANLKAGDVLMGCAKCMGLRPGEKINRLGKIRVVSIYREPLETMTSIPDYGALEVAREGFPEMTPAAFVQFFCKANKCAPKTIVTRIEFEYLD